jgi:hypothetical protein
VLQTELLAEAGFPPTAKKRARMTVCSGMKQGK